MFHVQRRASATVGALAAGVVLAACGAGTTAPEPPVGPTSATAPAMLSTPSASKPRVLPLEFDDGSAGTMAVAEGADGMVALRFEPALPLGASAVVQIDGAQADAGSLSFEVSRLDGAWVASRPLMPGAWTITVTVSDESDGFVSTVSANTIVTLSLEQS